MKKDNEIYVINFMGLEVFLRIPKNYPLDKKRKNRHLKLAQKELSEFLCTLFGVGKYKT